mmetsp:Transcript_9028/g.25950  ORF Transcript_9028/g.25950 Transcript_9028/m.25950 type:complete len:266 (+) Transcript_9028:362-1159(+)
MLNHRLCTRRLPERRGVCARACPPASPRCMPCPPMRRSTSRAASRSRPRCSSACRRNPLCGRPPRPKRRAPSRRPVASGSAAATAPPARAEAARRDHPFDNDGLRRTLEARFSWACYRRHGRKGSRATQAERRGQGRSRPRRRRFPRAEVRGGPRPTCACRTARACRYKAHMALTLHRPYEPRSRRTRRSTPQTSSSPRLPPATPLRTKAPRVCAPWRRRGGRSPASRPLAPVDPTPTRQPACASGGGHPTRDSSSGRGRRRSPG